MINDFFKKFLTKSSILDDYGIKYNHSCEIEIENISKNYSLSLLSNKTIIKCSGDDVENFLNTQFTNDVKNLNNNDVILSGYCNPKGRLISVFYIFQIDKDYYLYTTLDSKEALINKLNMYKMMSKVNFEVMDNIVVGITNIPKNNNLYNIKPESSKAIKYKGSVILRPTPDQIIIASNLENLIKLVALDNINILGYKSWDYLDIKNMIPFVTSSKIESYTPQMVSLDILNGVSFSKGCYPGQEIVARTHYLGKAKKSLYEISINSEQDIKLSDNIFDKEKNNAVGDIINISKSSNKTYSCLTVLRKESINKKLFVNNNEAVKIIKSAGK
tara:strand:- start:197 stop:1186 length:990 start_codon:yes stop_codon:yes gene_type:complete